MIRRYAVSPELAHSDIEAHEQDLLPGLQEMFVREISKTVGILSVGAKPDNLLMWAHYSYSHEGFVIGLDTSHDFFRPESDSNDTFGHPQKVSYRRGRPLLPFWEITGTEALLVKSPDWKYEMEWRVIRQLREAVQVLPPDDLGYPIHLFHLPPGVIKEVILGCRCRDDLRSEVEELLRHEDDYRHVELAVAKTRDRDYGLRIQKVPTQ